MRVRLVSGLETKAAKDAGRLALTPELTATVGAKYSRSNEGLEEIAAGIDPNDPDASVDRIFKVVEFGHQSIMDMVHVCLFIDEVSMIAAHLIWMQVPTASGQESSTRYIEMSRDKMISPADLGIPEYQHGAYTAMGEEAFMHYDRSVKDWDALSKEHPELTRIPESLLSNPKKQKTVARMRRNYAFDRARYSLPVGTATNMTLSMSARGWTGLVTWLLSQPLVELRNIGKAIVAELQLVTPRLLKHASFDLAMADVNNDEFTDLVEMAANQSEWGLWGAREEGSMCSAAPTPHLQVLRPRGASNPIRPLQHRTNRYSRVGREYRRTSVVYTWDAIALAEMRDMARHRPGNKEAWYVPQGHYNAEEEIPAFASEDMRFKANITSEFGAMQAKHALSMLAMGEHTYIYWTLLGTQYPFEHCNQAHHYIYESELRTDIGAHYRYAKHYREMLELFYQEFPLTRGLIKEGDAEPE